jgi:hypothetical protein
MTTDQKIARRKLRLLDFGNVSRTCKLIGYSRQCGATRPTRARAKLSTRTPQRHRISPIVARAIRGVVDEVESSKNRTKSKVRAKVVYRARFFGYKVAFKRRSSPRSQRLEHAAQCISIDVAIDTDPTATSKIDLDQARTLRAAGRAGHRNRPHSGARGDAWLVGKDDLGVSEINLSLLPGRGLDADLEGPDRVRPQPVDGALYRGVTARVAPLA